MRLHTSKEIRNLNPKASQLNRGLQGEGSFLMNGLGHKWREPPMPRQQHGVAILGLGSTPKTCLRTQQLAALALNSKP